MVWASRSYYKTHPDFNAPELEQAIKCHLDCFDAGTYKSLIMAAVVTGKLISLYQTTNSEL
jgi:hypothetical protein